MLKYEFKWEREVKVEIAARKEREKIEKQLGKETQKLMMEASSKSIDDIGKSKKVEKAKKDEKNKELKFEQDIINIFRSAIERRQNVEQNLQCSLDEELIEKLSAIPKVDQSHVHLIKVFNLLDNLIEV